MNHVQKWGFQVLLYEGYLFSGERVSIGLDVLHCGKGGEVFLSSQALSKLPVVPIIFWFNTFFKKDFIYLLLERGEGREKERERNINV